jgi:hypothetical protein
MVRVTSAPDDVGWLAAPKPWRWEIYTAGKSKPVRQSELFQTMSEVTRTGKAALAELQAKRVHP